MMLISLYEYMMLNRSARIHLDDDSRDFMFGSYHNRQRGDKDTQNTFGSKIASKESTVFFQKFKIPFAWIQINS